MANKKDELEGIEVCCFNCRHKDICRIVNGIWHPDFKMNLQKAAELGNQQKFFEGVERMLARICDKFDSRI